MNTSCAILTFTSYPLWYLGDVKNIQDTHKIRGDLAIAFAQKSAKLYPTFVAADDTNEAFLYTLKSIPNIHIMMRSSPLRAQTIRDIIQFAQKHESPQIFVLSEPEKVDLLNYVDMLITPILKNKTSFVIPTRNMKLFRQYYPDFQFQSEMEGNAAYCALLKKSGLLSAKTHTLDVFFGPRVFKNIPEVVDLFLAQMHVPESISTFQRPEDSTNGCLFPVIQALEKNIPLFPVKIPFRYPSLQKENEQKNEDVFVTKRKGQRESVMAHLSWYLSQKYKSCVS